MRSTLDAVDIVWKTLSDSEVRPMLSGGIYKHLRPRNSANEDIVVNALDIDMEQLQQCVVNVNLFVPDLSISHGEIEGLQPNHKRIQILLGIILKALSDVWGNDYHFDVASQSLDGDESDCTFANIRLEFYSENF